VAVQRDGAGAHARQDRGVRSHLAAAVVALDRIGDTYVELHGTEVARFIEASLALDR
jgi:hypothetical protein